VFKNIILVFKLQT